LGRGREEINAEKEEKGLREKKEIEYPKQRKSNIENNIKLNNIIFNLVCYGESYKLLFTVAVKV
jgi:hypothetical protein